MLFVDYRSFAVHYNYMLKRDRHSADVVYVDDIKSLLDSNVLWFLYRLHNSKINRIVKLPFKNIWFKYLVPKRCKSYNATICFILSPSIIIEYGKDFVDYLNAHYRSRIVVILGDKVEIYPKTLDLQSLKNTVNLICTYNPLDSKKYNLPLHPSMVYNLDIENIIPFVEREIDVLFIGQEKGRGEEIISVYKKCTELGLNCKFIIVGKTTTQFKGIEYKDWIPYPEVFEKIRNTKCVLNILQPGASGITLRDTEAYNLGCYLLTNNLDSELRKIFNEGQAILLNSLNKEIATAIKNREEMFQRKRNEFTMDNFYSWIEKNS